MIDALGHTTVPVNITKPGIKHSVTGNAFVPTEVNSY
jgi:hypothetical protein